MALSASNSQPWTFVVTDDPVLVKELVQKARCPLGSFNNFVKQAPVIVTIVSEKPKAVTEIDMKLSSFNVGVA